MNKRTEVILTVIGTIIGCVTLLFGDNLYQQLIGHSIFQSPQEEVNLPSNATQARATDLPYLTSTQELLPTAKAIEPPTPTSTQELLPTAEAIDPLSPTSTQEPLLTATSSFPKETNQANIYNIKSTWQTVLDEDFTLETKNWNYYYNWQDVEDGKYRLDCGTDCAWGVGLSKSINSDDFLLEFDIKLVDDFGCKSLVMKNESGFKTCGYVAISLDGLYIVFNLNKGEMFVTQYMWLDRINVLPAATYPAIRSGKGEWNTIQVGKYNSEIFIIANDVLLSSFPKRIRYDNFNFVVYSDTFVYIDNVLFFEQH